MKSKSCRSVSKRFRKCGKLLYKFKHSCLRHLLTKKSAKRKRKLSKHSFLSNMQIKLFKGLI